MIVCVCYGVSDCIIKVVIKNGVFSVEDLFVSLGVGICCGCCCEIVVDMFVEVVCSGGGCVFMRNSFLVFILILIVV